MTGRIVLTIAAVVVGLPVALLASAADPGPLPGPFDPAQLHGEIPEPMRSAYLDAAGTWELDWALLAAIGKVECDHGRHPAAGCNPPGTINHAGARGPMQFLGSTWRKSSGRYDLDVAGPPATDGHGYATDGDGDGIADPWSPFDAVHSAARYLVAVGGRDDPYVAAAAYYAGPANPDPTAGAGYATRVLELMAHYHTLAGTGGPGAPAAGTVIDGYALPFDRAGLEAVTVDRVPARNPEWQLVKPHHSGRVGADIPLPVGTRLYALIDGTVTWAGLAGNCGRALMIRHADQHATVTYCHLSSLDVTTRDQVSAGQSVGRSGGAPGTVGAGNSTGPHLHLHIDTPAGRRCPQALLLGLWRDWPVPAISSLRTTGCTYTTAPPPLTAPIPLPPDLPVPEAGS